RGLTKVKMRAQAASSALIRIVIFVSRMTSQKPYSKRALERMRAVRTHHEKELEQKFVGIGEAIVGHIPQMAITILATDLAELAGPIGENTGKTSVRQVGVGGATAAIE